MTDPTAPADPAELLDGLLERVVGVLSGTSSGEPVEGTDPDELVRARLAADGRVTALDADPRVLRDPARLAPAIVAAVNDAVAARPAASDRTATVAELRALQEESVDVTRRFNASLLASLEALKGNV